MRPYLIIFSFLYFAMFFFLSERQDNHEEAIACFTKAIDADPDCAMAWWGIAYSVSSSYNWCVRMIRRRLPFEHVAPCIRSKQHSHPVVRCLS